MPEMTMRCGFNMGSGSGAAATDRSKVIITPSEGGTVQMPDTGRDGMLIMTPAAPLQMCVLALPLNGPDLQQVGICSMRDIAALQFTGGQVLNAPTELIENQAIIVQRIDPANNTWILI